MKFGIRTPSIKKSISARTTGRVNRVLKSAVNPVYGKKGMGLINDPKKAIYNKVYNKTSVGVSDLLTSDSASSGVNIPEVQGVGEVPQGTASSRTASTILFVLGGASLIMLLTGNILTIILGAIFSVFFLGLGGALRSLGR